jgi:hypothetical protein
VDYLTTLFQYPGVTAPGGVIDEWWIIKDLEGNDRDPIEVLSRQLAGGTEEKHKNPVSIAGVLDEIRSENHQNISLGTSEAFVSCAVMCIQADNSTSGTAVSVPRAPSEIKVSPR